MQETKSFLLVLLFAGVAGVLVAAWGGGLSGQVSGLAVEGEVSAQLPLAAESDRPFPPEKTSNFSELVLIARSALVRDRYSGLVLYEKDPEAVLPIASLTKLMTAVVVHKHLSPQEILEITPLDVKTELYRAGLVPGERIRVAELLEAMLIASANDATLALARHLGGTVEGFVALMNQEAAALGMTRTAFTNPVGFDDPGHHSTAADLGLLVKEFLSHPDLLGIASTKETIIRSVDSRYSHKLATTNKLLLKYDEVRGLKTGYTAEAKGNLIILVDVTAEASEGVAEYYSIILGSNDREAETEQIMSWVRDNFQWTPLEISPLAGKTGEHDSQY